MAESWGTVVDFGPPKDGSRANRGQQDRYVIAMLWSRKLRSLLEVDVKSTRPTTVGARRRLHESRMGKEYIVYFVIHAMPICLPCMHACMQA